MSDRSPADLSRTQTLLVWPLALALIALGLYLSRIEYLGHEWLSRAGCLVVVLGIWSGLGGLIHERLLLGRLRWRSRNAVVRTRAELAAREITPDEINQEIEKIKAAFDQQGFELAQRLKVSLGIVELSVLITGTLIWGFGDLVVELLFFAGAG